MPHSSKPLSLKQRVADFLSSHHLTTARKWLVVGVSGGPDSVCLLHILNGLGQGMRLRLHVAHLDHQLRGAESATDAQYVLDLCHELGLPVTIEQRDVRMYQSAHHLSLEEAAREVRYAFFADVAASLGTDRLVLGHTLDDHAETVLLHIIRGTGMKGLRGLQPVNRWEQGKNQLTVLRPLLTTTHEETARYCEAHHLRPHLDPTNLSTELLRNRVRLELLPLLKTCNPRIVDALVRTARTAVDDTAYLEAATTRAWRRIFRTEDGLSVLDRHGLLKLPPALQRGVLRRTLEDRLGTLKDIEAAHIEDMMALAQGPAGKRLSLPYGLSFSVDYDRCLLGPATTSNVATGVPACRLSGEHPVAVPAHRSAFRHAGVPGVTQIPGWRVTTTLHDRGTGLRACEPLTAELDADKVGKNLVVRSRRPGDRFQPLGLGAEKKVARFLLDARVPQSQRDRVPLLCSGDRVLWVVGYRIDERVKVTPETKRVLRVVAERE